jgi:antirestriction protein
MEREPRGAGPEPTGNEQHDQPAGPERETTGGAEADERLRAESPRIYVASLSDYNAGVLHGEWLDAAQNLDDLETAVTAMLARSPSDPRAEEFAVHDDEGFGNCLVGEFDSLDWINRVAAGIAEHGLAFGAWAAQCNHDPDELDKFDEAYLGKWDSIEEYAEQLLDDFGLNRELETAIPEQLRSYIHIDVAGFARDMQSDLDITVVTNPSGGVWLFEGPS